MRTKSLARSIGVAGAIVLAAGGVARADAAVPTAPPGKGSARLAVDAFSVSVDDVAEIAVLVTTGQSTTDHQRAGVAADGASADLAGVVATASGGQRFMSPYPPLRSESAKGHDTRSEGDTELATPPPGSEGGTGTLATGKLHPARIETWSDDAGAGTALASEADTVDVLGGLSHLEGAGPGDHQTWTSPDEVGATARSLKIRSATLLNAGALLEALGVDVAALPDEVLHSLADALGIGEGVRDVLPSLVPGLPGSTRDEAVDAVASAPLVAVADVSASVGAVAAVAADGTALTSAHGAGSVGSVSVGANELGGFDLSQTAQDWNALEAAMTDLVNSVLATIGDGYADLARVRVAPVVVQETTASGGYAAATARIRLLDILVDRPEPDTSGLGLPDTGGVTDELDALIGQAPDVTAVVPAVPGVPGAGDVSGGTVDGLLGRSEGPGGIHVALGDMEASAEHTRPGVALRCDGMCDGTAAVLNRPWSPDTGFAVPRTLGTGSVPGSIGSGGGLDGDLGTLPRTGIPLRLQQLVGSGLVLGALAARRACGARGLASSVASENGEGR